MRVEIRFLNLILCNFSLPFSSLNPVRCLGSLPEPPLVITLPLGPPDLHAEQLRPSAAAAAAGDDRPSAAATGNDRPSAATAATSSSSPAGHLDTVAAPVRQPARRPLLLLCNCLPGRRRGELFDDDHHQGPSDGAGAQLGRLFRSGPGQQDGPGADAAAAGAAAGQQHGLLCGGVLERRGLLDERVGEVRGWLSCFLFPLSSSLERERERDDEQKRTRSRYRASSRKEKRCERTRSR